MEIRPYTLEDYPSLASWWEQHQWKPVAKEVLPVGSGWVVEAGEAPVCAGFLYTIQEVPQCAWMEWVVADPQADKETRSEALNGLIWHISNQAEKKGVRILFSAASHKNYLNRLENLGFVRGDEGMTHMVKIWRQ